MTPPSSEVSGTPSVSHVATETEEAHRAVEIALRNLESTGIPIGWQGFPDTLKEGLSKLCGLLVSIFAVSFGAPFWFDIRQRVVRLRGSGESLPTREREEAEARKSKIG